MGALHNILLFAQEGEHVAKEPSGTDLILPAVDELIWGAVAFAIVLFILTRFAFPKLREAVEAREKKIQEDLEAAESAKADAQREREEYKKQLAEARSEANRVIEDARGQAEQVRKDVLAKAEKEAEGVVARAQEQIEAERNRTIQELQTTIRDLSIELAEKVVGRQLDGGLHKELVDAYIKEVGTMKASSN